MAIIEKIPLSRSSERVKFDSGPDKYRCYSPSNPQYYKDKDGSLQAIDLNYREDTDLPTVGNSNISNKNIVSVGIRRDGNHNKFIGLRPDRNQHLGSEQLELSITSVEFDSVNIPIDLSKFKTIDNISTDLGSIIVRNNRHGSRQLFKAPNVQNDFKIIYKIDLTGLEIQNNTTEYNDEIIRPTDSGLDEIKVTGTFYEPDEQGNFNITDRSNNIKFVIREPKIIDNDFEIISTPDPISNIPMQIHGIHTLELTHGNTLEYTKYASSSCVGNFVDCSYIDADIIYGETTDGVINSPGSTFVWNTERAAGTGSGVAAGQTTNGAAVTSWNSGNFFGLARSFFMFDTSSVVGAISACSMNIYGATRDGAYNVTGDVSVQEGTQGTSLTNADYNQFTGVYFSTIAAGSWSASAYNTFTFNALGISKVDTAGITQICCRNYTRDYLNNAPALNFLYASGMTYANYTGTTRDPYLEIESGGAYQSSPSQKTVMFG